jgi:hypothetical protein
LPKYSDENAKRPTDVDPSKPAIEKMKKLSAILSNHKAAEEFRSP